MKKLIKYTLIAFISVNTLGGSYLGLREYSEDKEAKRAFEQFYNTDTQVMGAYDKKTPSAQGLSPSTYVLGGLFISILSFSIGMASTHLVMQNKQKKVEQSKPIPTKPTPKKLVRL